MLARIGITRATSRACGNGPQVCTQRSSVHTAPVAVTRGFRDVEAPPPACAATPRTLHSRRSSHAAATRCCGSCSCSGSGSGSSGERATGASIRSAAAAAALPARPARAQRLTCAACKRLHRDLEHQRRRQRRRTGEQTLCGSAPGTAAAGAASKRRRMRGSGCQPTRKAAGGSRGSAAAAGTACGAARQKTPRASDTHHSNAARSSTRQRVPTPQRSSCAPAGQLQGSGAARSGVRSGARSGVREQGCNRACRHHATTAHALRLGKTRASTRRSACDPSRALPAATRTSLLLSKRNSGRRATPLRAPFAPSCGSAAAAALLEADRRRGRVRSFADCAVRAVLIPTALSWRLVLVAPHPARNLLVLRNTHAHAHCRPTVLFRGCV